MLVLIILTCVLSNNMLNKLFLFLLLSIALLARNIPSDNKIQGRLNIINGASAECVMHTFYTQSGWIQIKGEIGRTGIDGLYYKKKNGVIKEVLVGESKWNSSRLGRSGKNKAIKQMSQEWVLRAIDKLIKKNPNMPYITLRQFINRNQYRARLFKIKPLSNNQIQISIYKIKNKGSKAFDEIIDIKLKPINVNHPKNSFEMNIVKAFNTCRSQYLHKYLDVLKDNEINELLKDNYIQKKDIKMIIGKDNP